MHIEGEEVKNAEDLNVRLPEGGTGFENVKEHECCCFFFFLETGRLISRLIPRCCLLIFKTEKSKSLRHDEEWLMWTYTHTHVSSAGGG